jgi:hypothetical protein
MKVSGGSPHWNATNQRGTENVVSSGIPLKTHPYEEPRRALTARPAYADLATLIAMADTDEVVRLRLLRAIRDLVG